LRGSFLQLMRSSCLRLASPLFRSSFLQARSLWAPYLTHRSLTDSAPREEAASTQAGSKVSSLKACMRSLDAVLYDYVVAMGVNETPTQKVCRETTATMGKAHMQISPDQGAFLGWLVRVLGVRKAAEVGVFTGYSSLCMLEGMQKNGKLYACELNEEYALQARTYWQKAGYEDNVELKLGAAIESMKELLFEHGSSFDFIFIDADKKNYAAYYELALKLLRPGGIVAIDNTLLHGKVVNVDVQQKAARAIQDLNVKLRSDDRVNISLIPSITMRLLLKCTLPCV